MGSNRGTNKPRLAMNQNGIIRYIDKKGLRAIFEYNDFSNPYFFFDLDTNPKLSLVIIMIEDWELKVEYILTKILLTHKRSKRLNG
jgi:hypothetical protein